MKSIAIALVATVIGTGALGTAAEARPQEHGRQTKVEKKIVRKSVKRTVNRTVGRSVNTSHIRPVQRSWASHPVYRSVHGARRVLLNNVYTGSGYHSANRWYSPSAIRFLSANDDGTCNVWFDGSVYRAFSRYSGGRLVLYLGSAPTSAGYHFEIVLY